MNDRPQSLTLTLPPERWETVAPPEGTVFLAQRRGDFEYFRPTIAVEATALNPGITLADVATVLLGRIRQVDASAEVRSDTSQVDEGRLLQAVRFALHADGLPPLRLDQRQVVVLMETDDPDTRPVVTFVLTAEEDAMGEYFPDFQAFIGSATVTGTPSS